MKVLSLFDGISCARVALERAGIQVDLYFASEIDKYATQIAHKNYPDTVHLGDVRCVTNDLGPIDLLIGGSPCQDLSIAKKDRMGLDGARSGLFREYVRILDELKPKRFILENVNSMPKEARQLITETLGVDPIMINAALVSAQNRKRLFWTNIPGVTQPNDRGIILNDILQPIVDEKYTINLSGKYGLKGLCEDKAKSMTASMYKGYGNDGVSIVQAGRGFNKGGQHFHKSPTLTSSSWEHNNHLVSDGKVRKLTPIECERLQGLLDNYTEGVSDSQRYKCLGNAFNVDVVAHILSFIPTSSLDYGS